LSRAVSWSIFKEYWWFRSRNRQNPKHITIKCVQNVQRKVMFWNVLPYLPFLFKYIRFDRLLSCLYPNKPLAENQVCKLSEKKSTYSIAFMAKIAASTLVKLFIHASWKMPSARTKFCFNTKTTGSSWSQRTKIVQLNKYVTRCDICKPLCNH